MSGHAYEVLEGVALASRGDECALYEKLVLAFDDERRVLLHGLEQHWEKYQMRWRMCERKVAALPCTSMPSPGSILPEFGRTQYCCR
jgi:DNA-directed RNA polymerase subunit N (RpoN/RPB10)